MAIFNQIYNQKNGNGNKIFKYIKSRFQFSLNPIHSAYSDSDCTSLIWEHRGVVLIDYDSALSEGPKNEMCCPAGGPAPLPRVTPNVWIWPNLGKCPPDRSRLQHSFRLDQVRMREGTHQPAGQSLKVFDKTRCWNMKSKGGSWAVIQSETFETSRCCHSLTLTNHLVITMVKSMIVMVMQDA